MSTPFPVTVITTGQFMRLVSEGKFPFAKKDSERYKQWIVMMVMLANADRNTFQICMTHKEVGERAGMSESSVRRTFETLRGSFELVGHGRKNIPIYRPILPGLIAVTPKCVERQAVGDVEVEQGEEFDALAIAAPLSEPVNGVDPDTAKVAIRWWWNESSNTYWRDKITDADALRRALPTMVKQYERDRKKSPAPRPRFSMATEKWTPNLTGFDLFGERLE